MKKLIEGLAVVYLFAFSFFLIILTIETKQWILFLVFALWIACILYFFNKSERKLRSQIPASQNKDSKNINSWIWNN